MAQLTNKHLEKAYKGLKAAESNPDERLKHMAWIKKQVKKSPTRAALR